MESLEQKIKRVTAEDFSLTDYNPAWTVIFEREKEFLLAEFPSDFILGIEHIGSTAVPGLRAKPIVDMLVIISDDQRGRDLIPAKLDPLGYDCFWRPTMGDDVPPWYTWCIRRDKDGRRTHHLHFAESGVKDAELRFRDILLGDSALASDYARLKTRLWREHPGDRVAYTMAKGEFINKVLARAE